MIAALIIAGALAAQQSPVRLDLVCEGQANVSTSTTTNIGEPGGPVNFVTTNDLDDEGPSNAGVNSTPSIVNGLRS